MSITNRAIARLKQLKWLATVGILIFVAVLTFGSFALNRKKGEIAEFHATETREDRRTLIESEVVTVTPRGFEPGAITRQQGRFILMVDNRSGSELNLRFTRETGESLHNVRSSRQEPDWNDVLDLRPGKYLLTEADHPSWVCVITIAAN
jgi:hypothetical protein